MNSCDRSSSIENSHVLEFSTHPVSTDAYRTQSTATSGLQGTLEADRQGAQHSIASSLIHKALPF